MTCFYNFSGGMESAAMLVVDRKRIEAENAIVCWVDTGKQFPEMQDSIAQIEGNLSLMVHRAPLRISFDEYLFERGGMLRKGMNDCSRRMKRTNLKRFHEGYAKPWEINIGFNAEETERAESFVSLNERAWCHWRFPLIEAGIERWQTKEICRQAGFSILVGMYEKMGRFDCFWCPNQSPKQALKVAEHYPELASEWIEAENRKGHSFLRLPLATIVKQKSEEPNLFAGCSCFGGDECVWDD